MILMLLYFIYKLNKLNLCAEWINYTPVSLADIIKSGILTNISTIGDRVNVLESQMEQLMNEKKKENDKHDCSEQNRKSKKSSS